MTTEQCTQHRNIIQGTLSAQEDFFYPLDEQFTIRMQWILISAWKT